MNGVETGVMWTSKINVSDAACQRQGPLVRMQVLVKDEPAWDASVCPTCSMFVD